MKSLHLILFIVSISIVGCKNKSTLDNDLSELVVIDTTTYTKYSQNKNQYSGFDAPKAINKIADIENEYFRNYENGYSKYYGTIWKLAAQSTYDSVNQTTLFDQYKNQLQNEPDSMHCTIYAMHALKAGMDSNFVSLDNAHKEIWKNREYAGWSIGYLLVRDWNWKAYLVIDNSSPEYQHVINAYNQTKSYPVWRQPNIPLEDIYIYGQDDSLIQQLLLQHEFGWGFSHQGIHTWITRFDELKECYWSGAPSKKFDSFGKPLFLKHQFLDYRDYASHVIVFPPIIQ